MRVEFDSEADALYIRLTDERVARSIELGHCVVGCHRRETSGMPYAGTEVGGVAGTRSPAPAPGGFVAR